MKEFEINYVISKYEKSIKIGDNEYKYLLYPSKSNILVVCMSTLSKHIYERVRMLWNNNEEWKYNYLFISDNNGEAGEGLYYIGDTKEKLVEKYTMDIIEKIKKEQCISNIITLGSSMGGYSAIYYALKYDYLGAIAVVPQVNKKVIDEYGWQKWKVVSNVVSEGNFPDLVKMISDRVKIPSLFIQYGDYEADIKAADALKEILKDKFGLTIFEKFEEKNHTSQYMTKDLIESIIELFILVDNRNILDGGVN